MSSKQALARRLILILALIGIYSLSANKAEAQQISGNSLYEACRSDNSVMGGFCIGYIIGVIEGRSFGAFQVLERLDPSESTAAANNLVDQLLGHCIPENASNEQLRDVALSYLSKNPETRHETARLLLWLAYVEAFPCEQ